MAGKYPPILAIDFDGTIVENKFPEIGRLKKDAKWVINKLKEAGCKIVIWTSRDGKYIPRLGKGI